MNWVKLWSREYSTQYCDIIIRSMGPQSRFLPVRMQKQLLIPHHKNQCFYLAEQEKDRFIWSTVEKFSGNLKRFRDFVKLFYQVGMDYENTAKKIGLTDLNQLDNHQLKKLYLTYQKIFLDYTCIVFIGFILNEHWTEYGNKIIKTKNDQVREALFKPIKKSTVLMMLEEASKIKNNKEKIKQLWQKYQWLPCMDLQYLPWTLKDVEDYIKNIKLGEPYPSISFEEAAQKAHLTAEEIKTFQMIKEIAYIKDARDDFRRKGIFYIQKLFVEIAKRMNLSLKETAFLTEKEIIDFLDNKKVDLSKGKKRQTGFLIYLKDNQVICVDHNIDDELKKLGFKETEEKIKELKGTIANKGQAKGTVKIVRTVHDILKVNEGDILVAVTTHPDYVPAMQKAAAIITDEGGLLCHAAIVSRELGIPCIVGTKTATKFLQHGEKVEVDADNGIIKKTK